MWKIIFAFAVSCAVTSAMHYPGCHPFKCITSTLSEAGDPDNLTGETFIEYCPEIMRFVECISDEVQTCMGSTFEELATSENEDRAALGKILLGSSDLLIDLCDEDTQIHKDFVANIECIGDVLQQNENSGCQEEAHTMFSEYASSLESESNFDCLSAGYVFACISGKINKQCGEVARNAFVEIGKRTKILQSKVCSPKDILELKNEFKEFLQLEGERQSVFEQAFDLRKRK